jgi:hypothetical protein
MKLINIIPSHLYDQYLMEQYYDDLSKVDKYVDADDIIGKRVWVHTNRTHLRQHRNGLIGLYPPNANGLKHGSPIGYTNEIRIAGNIVFEQPEGAAERIKQTQHRQVIGGVSGTVVDTDSGNTSGMDPITYNPFSYGYFHLIQHTETPPRKIIGAEAVYFTTYPTPGKEFPYGYLMYAKSPVFEDER